MASSTKKSFGRKPSRIPILKNLIRNYPRGLGIIKEFVQNTDDAGASDIVITLDLRRHEGKRLPDQRMNTLMGPALLLSNNQVFSDSDLESIERIGESSKVEAGPKTGRFGLGFNTSYNITDYPSFVTGRSIYCFDPHRDACADGDDEGAQWDLSELWGEQTSDWPALFCAGGLQQNATDHPGTVFRLPLRDQSQARRSKICNEPFLPSHFEEMVEQLWMLGPAILLFTRHLASITVCEIPAAGVGMQRTRLRFQTLNPKTVSASRKLLNKATTGSLVKLIESWEQAPATLVRKTYLHLFEAERDGVGEQQLWQVTQGLYSDAGGKLLGRARDLIDAQEKALPLAGIAIRLSGTLEQPGPPQPIKGEVFCSLPIRQSLSLPVHINGYFDLDASRHALTDDPKVAGLINKARLEWNEFLLQHAVAVAYAEGIQEATQYVPASSHESVRAYYNVWPQSQEGGGRLRELLGNAVYEQLSTRPSLGAAVAQSACWVPVADGWLIPADWHAALVSPLVASAWTAVDPRPPEWVIQGFEGARIRVCHLRPADLAKRLRMSADIDCDLANATVPCLRQRDSIESILRFCLTDAKVDLKGLPLAILCDDKLHTFGFNKTGPIFTANKKQRTIFALRPHDFIDPGFYEATGLGALKDDACLLRMTPEQVIARLSLLPFPSERPANWDPSGDAFPTERWLHELLSYLNQLTGFSLKAYKKPLEALPLVPDQFGKIHTPWNTRTPLLPTDDIENGHLRRALDKIEIPLVSGGKALLGEFRRLHEAHPDAFVWSLSGPDLVDCLSGCDADHLRAMRFSSTVHAPLLNYLSDSRWCQTPSGTRFSAKQVEILRALPLLPTEQGDAVAVTDAGVCISADVPAPEVLLASDLRLIRADQTQWQPLLQLLRVPRLELSVLLKKTLDAYQQLGEPEQVSLLSWIRDEVQPRIDRLKSKNAPAAEVLQKQLSSAPLIRCNDGKLRTGYAVYAPGSSQVQKILGDLGVTPDMRLYSVGKERWVALFAMLGMVQQPRPLDLQRRVAALSSAYTQADPQGRAIIKEQLVQTLEYINETWKDLAQVQIREGQQQYAFHAFFQRSACMPAITDQHEAKRYLAFKPPEDRLYRPDELYLASRAHVVASQAPICAVSGLNAAMAKAVGFKLDPPLEVVLRHFDAVRHLFQKEEVSTADSGRLDATMTEIYRQLSRCQQGEATSRAKTDWAALRERCESIPCLWDRTKRRFWEPRHVFATAQPFMEPLRGHLDHDDAAVRRGMDLLGRRAVPDFDDLVLYLDELDAIHDGGPLSKDNGSKALLALRRINEELHDEEDLSLSPEEEPLLLTTTLQLEPSDNVFINDAPWFRNQIDLRRVHLVHAQIDRELLAILDVRHLSDAIIQEPLGPPILSKAEAEIRRCQQITTTLRSREFQKGLQRLLYVQQQEEEANLSWLASCEVVPCSSLPMRLKLRKSDDSLHEVGQGSYEADWFIDDDSNRIMVRTQSPSFIPDFVAAAFQRKIGSKALTDLAPLTRILGTTPAQVMTTLDTLRVPDPDADGDAANLSDEDFATQTPDASEDSFSDPPADDLDNIAHDFDEDAEPTSPSVSTGHQRSQVGAAHPVPPSPPAIIESASSPLVNTNQDEEAAGVNPSPIELSTSDSVGEASEVVAKPRPPRTGERRPKGNGVGESKGSGDSSPASSSPGPADSEIPPIEPGTGQGGTSAFGASGGIERIVTYVSPVSQLPRNMEHAAARSELELAAIEIAMATERKNSRQPSVAEVGTAGFDIVSHFPDSDTRYIIVKGLPGAWTIAGVTLSGDEFDAARKHAEQAWLYVIEELSSAAPILYCIQNPATRITQFRLDHGWKDIAQVEACASTQMKANTPAIGWLFQLPTGPRGTIEDIELHGAIRLLKVRYPDGSLRDHMEEPDMQILPPNFDARA